MSPRLRNNESDNSRYEEAAGTIKQKLNPFDVGHYQSLVKPHWYDG